MIVALGNYVTVHNYLRHHLNLSPEVEADHLDVDGIARVAVLAVAHSEEYAATAHLVSLVGSLPVPSDEPKDFWFRLFQASGSAIFLPANIKGQVLRALGGDGLGLALQMLNALTDMDRGQRAAAALVITEALKEVEVTGFPAERIGEWWLSDVESTAWRVLHATKKTVQVADQKDFEAGWRDS
ncbi:hypothetical protein ABT246_37765 [Streptomyces sp. NPDC001553]|uniref:hypothetical protein n=1 Tax=Streptomyces sp. NPDC001553 TaxID=3154385 RepID=UPI003321ED45